jgi:pilus assembly protein Flp/PilA
MGKFISFLRDTRGGTAIEYGLIAALIVMGAFIAYQNLANSSNKLWNNVSNAVSKG